MKKKKLPEYFEEYDDKEKLPKKDKLPKCLELSKEDKQWYLDNYDYLEEGQVEFFTEMLITQEDCDEFPSTITDDLWGTNKDERILVYEMYFLDHRTVNDIQFHVSYSRRHIHEIIKMLRDNIDYDSDLIRDKILKLHFIDGVPLSKVGSEFGCEEKYIYKVLYDYFLKVFKYKLDKIKRV